MALSGVLQKIANSLLTNAQFGTPATLIHRSGGKYDPETGFPASGKVPESVTVVFVDAEGHEVESPERDGVSATTGQPDVKDVLIAATDVVEAPKRRDELTISGSRWEIKRVGTTEIAGQAVMYRCQIRR